MVERALGLDRANGAGVLVGVAVVVMKRHHGGGLGLDESGVEHCDRT